LAAIVAEDQFSTMETKARIERSITVALLGHKVVCATSHYMTAETTFVATVAKLICIFPNGFISFSFVRALFVCFCFCSALK